MSVEPLVARWKATTTPQVRPALSETFLRREMNEHSIRSMLDLVLELRYLHTRILLHRQMIVCFLQYDANDDVAGCELEFLRTFGKSSLDMCLRASLATLDLLNTTNVTAHPQNLTRWWFQIYYGESHRPNFLVCT